MIEGYDDWVQASDPAMVVVTVAAGGERSGCLAGFHTQLSIEPRRHLVGISRVNHTFGPAAGAGHVGVHLLSDDQHGLAALFGEQTGDEVDKFSECAWADGPEGVPILSAVSGWFVGRIVERVDAGDHLGLLLAPVAVAAPAAGSVPLRLGAVADLDPGHPA